MNHMIFFIDQWKLVRIYNYEFMYTECFAINISDKSIQLSAGPLLGAALCIEVIIENGHSLWAFSGMIVFPLVYSLDHERVRSWR